MAAVQKAEGELTEGCPTGLIRNPLTGKCIGESTKDGQLIKALVEHKKVGYKCPTGYVINPDTGYCIKISGKSGKKLLGNWNCSRYGERDPNYVFTPLPHQQAVADYFNTLKHPGILLYWSLGSGKSCGANLILDTYLNNHPEVSKVYVFSTGSLRENFLYQYCMICGQDRKRIQDMFDFISYNYSMIGERLPSPTDLENSIVIIDEVQNLITGYVNGSKIYADIYELLVSSINVKYILLSGTPITRPIDMYFILNLIKPTAFTTEDDYNKHITGKDDTPDITWIEAISDVVSHVAPTFSIQDYPKVIRVNVTVPMSDEQYEDYLTQREIEKAIPPNEKLQFTDPNRYKMQKTMYYLAISYLRSRQRCNMVYPEDIREQFNEKETALPDKLDTDGGWITPDIISELEHYSPKFDALINMILSTSGKHVVYSEFKIRYGVYFIAAILDYNITYLMFTGDLNDEQRTDILRKFNGPDNLYGEKYQVMLITEAASQGQNLLQVMTLNIMEESINEFDIKQVEGRVVRYGSHNALPEELRHVTIYRYYALTPGDPVSYDEVIQKELKDRMTSDFFAHARGVKRVNSCAKIYEVLDNLPVVPQ